MQMYTKSTHSYIKYRIIETFVRRDISSAVRQQSIVVCECLLLNTTEFTKLTSRSCPMTQNQTCPAPLHSTPTATPNLGAIPETTLIHECERYLEQLMPKQAPPQIVTIRIDTTMTIRGSNPKHSAIACAPFASLLAARQRRRRAPPIRMRRAMLTRRARSTSVCYFPHISLSCVEYIELYVWLCVCVIFY